MSLRTIQEEQSTVGSLKMITQAYEEIATRRMQRVRASVLANRFFYSNCSEVFYNVKSSYKRKIKQLLEKKREQYYKQKGKPLAVLLTANNHLSGEINPQVFHDFAKHIENQDVEILLVGILGKEMYEQQVKKKYTFFNMPETLNEAKELKEILDFTLHFPQVDVYYGQFENVLFQKPATANISGDLPFIEEQKHKEEEDYFFEPSLETILRFFETQVMISLFIQTMHESQLANYASRIRAMEEALTHISKRRGELLQQEKRVHALQKNTVQTERLAGMSIWMKQ